MERRCSRPALAALLVLLVLPAALVAGGARAQEGRAIAILPLTALGLSEDALLSVEGAFREAVRTTPGVRLQDRATTLQGLARARDAGLTCDEGDEGCLQGLGAVLEVDEIISGTVSEDPYKYGIALKILDVAAGTSKKKTPSSISKDPAELYVGMRRAAADLLEVYVGALAIALDVEGARVVVDGVDRGATPLPPLEDVPVGARRLEVRAEGLAPFARDVDVRVGEQTVVSLAVVDGALVEAVDVAPVTPGVSVPLAAIGGGVAALGVVGVVAGVFAALGADAAAATADTASGDALGAAADDNRALVTATYALYGVGGALAAVGAGVVGASFFIDPFGE